MMWKISAFALTIAAMPVAAALTITPPSAAMAKQYVDQIYETIPTRRFDYSKLRYTADLRALIDRDAVTPAGTVGALDGIAFCECRYAVPDYRFTSQVTETEAGATVVVSLNNGIEQQFSIDLISSEAGWLVADVHGPGTASLVAYLRTNKMKRK